MDSLEREARERKKKVIALASLPLCMGFFVWRLQTTTVAAPPPKAPPPSVVAQAAPAVAAAAGPVLTLEKQRVVEVPLGEKDPFMASVDLTPATNTAPPPQFSAPNTKTMPVAVTEIGPSVSALPPANPTLNSFGAPSGVGTGPSVAVKPLPTGPETLAAPVAPPMPYVLCGIVKGNPDVAVLRHFDGSRRIVRAGDALDAKFRLSSIQETAVVITGDGDSKTLRLGGDVPVAPVVKK